MAPATRRRRSPVPGARSLFLLTVHTPIHHSLFTVHRSRFTAVRYQCNNPDRPAGTTFYFHRQRHNDKAGGWQLIEIGQILQAAHVVGRGIAVHDKVFGIAIVNGCCIHSQQCDSPLVNE